MSDMLRRTWAEVHLDCLEENMSRIRCHVRPGCRLMAMVKADAYGHGAVPVARAMERFGADWLGVSNLEEAIQLRRAGIEVPILIVSYTPPSEAERLATYRITQTVLSAEYGEQLSRFATDAGVTLPVHIKVDTGMSRVGFSCHSMEAVPMTANAVASVCRLPGLLAEGIFTHFASADEEDDDGFTAEQFALFQAVTDALAERGIIFALRHCCNSAATLRFPAYHLDMVRPGIILYGLHPDGWMRETYPGFRPAMELKTTVSQAKDLPAAQSVSYNRTYSTTGDTRLATVAIGYGDGYSRALSNRGYMLIKGYKAPVVGRVCMDQCVLDVTGVPNVQAGDTVTVCGRDGESFLSVDTLADLLGTIHYELICLVSKRVPRLYIHNGEAVDNLDYILSD